MPRKREDCEFCDCGYDSYTRLESVDSDELVMEAYPGHCINVSAIMYNPVTEEHYEAQMSIPFDYCPCCGRKWAM